MTTFPRIGRFSRATAWPTPPGAKAFHGLAGDLVRLIEPHSEADPVALLAQILVVAGNVIGRGPGFVAEGDEHHTNEFVAIVGETSKSRKGTSYGRVKQAFNLVDEEWAAKCATSGLSSGEGVVWRVRDPIVERRRARKGEDAPDGYVEETTDHGIDDKRLLVVEGELAQALRVMRREGNTLSVTLRNLWDSGTQGSLTKNSPARTTNAHVSLVGHISAPELRRELTATDAANGFANRFLFVCAKRSKLLPDGGRVPESELRQIARLLATVIEHGRGLGELRRDDHARVVWHRVYGELSEGRPGMLGAITGRAEAHVMRLAVLYAVLDGSPAIQTEHLEAALALWDYCERSAAFIFGERLGDPIADEILEALDGGELTRSEIRDHFGRHKSSADISAALRTLEEAGAAVLDKRGTAGRPVEVWRRAESAESAESLEDAEDRAFREAELANGVPGYPPPSASLCGCRSPMPDEDDDCLHCGKAVSR
jgi:hypothetical protein